MDTNMNTLLDEFQYRRSSLNDMNYGEVNSRLLGFLEWIMSNELTAGIHEEIWDDERVKELLESRDPNKPPSATTPEDIAMLGLFFIQTASEGNELWSMSGDYGIRPSYKTNSIQDITNEVISRYIEPALDYFEKQVSSIEVEKNVFPNDVLRDLSMQTYPLEITNSLQKFMQDHSDVRQTAFIMMKFGTTKAHEKIIHAIKSTLLKYGIVAMRADDKEYHDDLFPNVLTYVYGCNFGIAVFERLEAEEFNPNVSLEVGYMRALKKSVCLLKDQTIRTMQTDLLGKLYKSFDPQDPTESIPQELEKWLIDKDIIT